MCSKTLLLTLQYICEQANLIQLFLELQTIHDPYGNFYQQAKELPTASAKIGVWHPHLRTPLLLG